ncbi:ubiquitin receptor RAD23b-like [Senna tora]|uniref:Ubiquitin receptor RAD23b-like n=1 Tax=Senna tora TaxID=362788 RepID=A0A834XFT0_9FABA|nr:ubiquitin receptor RAD23b-like [Senna tora]
MIGSGSEGNGAVLRIGDIEEAQLTGGLAGGLEQSGKGSGSVVEILELVDVVVIEDDVDAEDLLDNVHGLAGEGGDAGVVDGEDGDGLAVIDVGGKLGLSKGFLLKQCIAAVADVILISRRHEAHRQDFERKQFSNYGSPFRYSEVTLPFSPQIMAVKRNIEDVQGKDNYPCGQQLLIHSGQVLKDETTLAENKVTEDGFLVVMLSKNKTLSSAGTSSAQPASNPTTTVSTSNSIPVPEPHVQPQAANNITSATDDTTTNVPMDTYDDDAASNLVAGTNLEQTIRQIMDMGSGNWDRETVIRALQAAFNNPERAIDYLYSGIPEAAEVAEPVGHFPASQTTERSGAPAGVAPGAPNSSPLNMFPQEAISGAGAGAGDGAGVGSLDFLRNNPQVVMVGGVEESILLSVIPICLSRFQTLRTVVQTNPQILQPVLQELGKQNPQLFDLIQDHHAEFFQLINEPVDGSEGDIFDQPEQDLFQSNDLTAADQEAIARLEALGFDRASVLEAFLACDRDEQLAANYLLENAGDFED